MSAHNSSICSWRTYLCAFAATAFMAAAPASASDVDEVEIPRLSQAVAPETERLRSAGIESIVARTGKKRRDIQVFTRYGTTYFPWPKGSPQLPFEIYVGTSGNAGVYAAGYSDSSGNQARYEAAFEALLPEAVRQAQLTRAAAQRPKR